MDKATSAVDMNSGVRVVVLHGGDQASEAIRQCPATWTVLSVSKSLLVDVDRFAPDVVIVDQSATVDLVRVCRDVRSVSPARIIALGDATGNDDTAAIEVLRAGADDYLPRATRMPALVARINATPRTGAGVDPSPGQRVGDVEIDDTGCVLRVAGDIVPCSRLRLALLRELARSPNVIVSTQSLLEVLWGSNATRAHVRRLRIVVTRVRKVLGSGPGRPRIEAVGGGYRLSIEPG